MSDKKTVALPFPSRVMRCALCGNQADGQCTRCSASVCKGCWKTHKSAHENPPLTAMGCIICGGPPEELCPTCSAPVCHQLACQGSCRKAPGNLCQKACGKTCCKFHEDTHFDQLNKKKP